MESPSSTFYNDNDPFVAQWLRNLIVAGIISGGVVDARDIKKIKAEELAGYKRAHFFAGIGGWELALQLSGWPPELPVWTGSCPCQPFSRAGRKKGFQDDRHLWPDWFRLIRECRPPVIFGEQVESQAAKAWLDTVFDDLEGIGYTCGAAVLPAASVGAPHLRHRIWFVAHSSSEGLAQRESRTENPCQKNRSAIERGSVTGHLGDSEGAGQLRAEQCQNHHESCERRGSDDLGPDGKGAGFWDDSIWLVCRDGKARPTQPGIFPLADGVPSRVGRLRAYGNAIVPQVAAEFIKTFMEVRTFL